MDELDKQILNQTVILGSRDLAEAPFSLAELAQSLSLSESQLLTRFKTREQLLHEAVEMVFTSEMAFIADISTRGPRFEYWVNRLLDYFLFHKEETFFILNYGMGLAKASLAKEDLKAYHDNMIFWGKKILCFFALASDEEYFFVWSATFRSFVYAAANIMRGECADGEKTRRLLVTLIGHGMNALMKGPRV